MDFKQLIEAHRSIRKFKNTPLSKELVERILNAGLRASSSGNMQTYSVIATTDEDIKRELFKPHFEQEMLLQAPLMLTFCADFHRMREWVKLSNAADNFDNFMSFMIAAIDAVLASQNVALAAESEGLGICYMGTTLASCLQIADILKCPDHVVPVVGFVVGYPDENPLQRDRLPLDGIVHYETYQSYPPERIAQIYEERERKGWERYMTQPELRKIVEESDVKNLAQVYTQIKYTRESHIQYSKNVLKCLTDRGFFNHEMQVSV